MARLLYTKRLIDLEPDEYQAVLKCNMGTNGSMRAKVKALYEERDREARVTMSWSDDNELQGCCLIFSYRDEDKIVYTYVHRKWRRRGIGTALLAHSRRGRRKPLRACPWDEVSEAFYSPFLADGKVINHYRPRRSYIG